MPDYNRINTVATIAGDIDLYNYMIKVRWPLLFLMLLYLIGAATVTHAATPDNTSRRIEVYALSQNHWDVQRGDTLSGIAAGLLPNNPSKWKTLQQEILSLNPDAFIDGDPARLLAGKRLWLPGYMKQPDSLVDPATTTVERYTWGNIKRKK